jgi:SAM-dependent methyltransferase
MLLSELVRYLNFLDVGRPDHVLTYNDQRLKPLLEIVDQHPQQYSELTTKLSNSFKNTLSSVQDYLDTVSQIKLQLQATIAEYEPAYYAKSREMFFESLSQDNDQYILSRRLELDPEIEELLTSRIKLYSNWRWPGLVIRPAREPWVRDLVALDPMYIADISSGLLDPTVAQFPIEYQNRICRYLYAEDLERPMLNQLPQQQMGFVLVYNYFNYRPAEFVHRFLAELHALLKPGGVIGLTFNDCDHAAAVKLVENKFMCYTPGRRMQQIFNALGFSVVKQYNLDGATTWIEIKKAGELASFRGGQSLARVVANSK